MVAFAVMVLILYYITSFAASMVESSINSLGVFQVRIMVFRPYAVFVIFTAEIDFLLWLVYEVNYLLAVVILFFLQLGVVFTSCMLLWMMKGPKWARLFDHSAIDSHSKADIHCRTLVLYSRTDGRIDNAGTLDLCPKAELGYDDAESISLVLNSKDTALYSVPGLNREPSLMVEKSDQPLLLIYPPIYGDLAPSGSQQCIPCHSDDSFSLLVEDDALPVQLNHQEDDRNESVPTSVSLQSIPERPENPHVYSFDDDDDDDSDGDIPTQIQYVYDQEPDLSDSSLLSSPATSPCPLTPVFPAQSLPISVSADTRVQDSIDSERLEKAHCAPLAHQSHERHAPRSHHTSFNDCAANEAKHPVKSPRVPYLAKHRKEVATPMLINVKERSRFVEFPVENLLVERKLGQGAFGSVYRTRERNTKKKYAVKMIPIEKRANEQEFQRRILRIETHNHSTMSEYSQHFAQLHAAYKTSTDYLLIQEYCKHGDLEGWLRNAGRFSVETTVDCVAQIVYMVDLMQRKGILHRDIKPANILVDKHYHLRLTDFGLSHRYAMPCRRQNLYDDPNYELSEGVGTPDYAPPEMIYGASYNRYVDFYSVGIMTYELLTGELPPRGVLKTPENCGVEVLDHPDFSEIPVAHARYLTDDALDFIKTLVYDEENPYRRVTIEEIKTHPFLRNAPWYEIENGHSLYI